VKSEKGGPSVFLAFYRFFLLKFHNSLIIN
jgi:hypothetical protein